MFVFVLFFIAIASVLLVDGTSSEKVEKRRNMKETIGALNNINAELKTYIDGQGDTGHKVGERRQLTCTCGTYKPNGGLSTSSYGCCFCITDGCGSSASVCCDKHTYCNCVNGDCGICIDLGTNTRSNKFTDRYGDSIKTFKAIYSGTR